MIVDNVWIESQETGGNGAVPGPSTYLMSAIGAILVATRKHLIWYFQELRL